jgi:hypothetical protein
MSTRLPARASGSRSLVTVPDSARGMGIHIVAGKGSGKSRLMGRGITFRDSARRVPTILIDPHGPSIDNYLDKVYRLEDPLRREMFSRMLYVDVGAESKYVVSFPLYYRLGDESLAEVAERYLEAIRKLSPSLETASVMGLPAILNVGRPAGMVLTALGAQITEVQELLTEPKQWLPRIEQAARGNDELLPALAFFRRYSDLRPNDQRQMTYSFLSQVGSFVYDKRLMATFGASSPGIDWQDVLDKRLTVLLDFRHVQQLEHRRFALLWCFTSLLEFVKRRGPGHYDPSKPETGKHIPISLLIDEIVYLLSLQTLHTSLLDREIDELINQIARNYSLWLTLAHQEMYQLSPQIQRSLITMGSQVMGLATDEDSARFLARRFFPYDPYRVKKTEPIYMSYEGVASVIDHREIEFSIDEQLELNSRQFTDRETFHFLVTTATREGTAPTRAHAITTAPIDPGQYVDEAIVPKIRARLAKRSGRHIDEVITEIRERQKAILSPGIRDDTMLFNDPSSSVSIIEGTQDEDLYD